jgi:hypothetical protein
MWCIAFLLLSLLSLHKVSSFRSTGHGFCKRAALFVSTLDEYKQAAFELLNTSTVDETVLRVALKLMEKDMNKDKEVELLEKDKDKEVELLEKDKDKELKLLQKDKEKEVQLLQKDKDKEVQLFQKDKELLQKDKEVQLFQKDKELLQKDQEVQLFQKDKELLLFKQEMQMNLTKAYFLGILADISQREILETFFNQIVGFYINKNELFMKAVHKLEPESLQKSFIANCKKEFPTMTTINSALSRSEELRKVVWKLMGFSEDVIWPNFRAQLLYPILSATAHSSGVKKVYFPSDMDPVLKTFYEQLCKVYDRRTEEVDAELIALAREEGIEI